MENIPAKSNLSLGRWAITLGLPIVAVLMVGGGEVFVRDASVPTAAAMTLPDPATGPRNYDEALLRAAQSVQLGRERVAKGGDEWMRLESLARALARRSRLTGDFGDLAEAMQTIDTAQRVAPANSGPMLSRAVLGMASHRMADTQEALSSLDEVAVAPVAGDASEIAALRGDVAFYHGRPVDALVDYEKARSIAANAGTSIRMARLAKSRGDFDGAQKWFLRSTRSGDPATPYLIAQVSLHLGGVELARGDYAAATGHFEAADKVFPGHWLIHAHLAQSKAVSGDLNGAIEALTRLAAVGENADLMDALANLHRANGDPLQSRKWASRAGAIWRERLELLPEAAIGHALEHELAFGSASRAVELARQNLALRSYGDARLLLAQALMKAGQHKGALEQVKLAKKSGWRSAPLFALESDALTVLGQLGEAKAARKQALALNPRIFDPETSLIWFSHG